MEKLGYWIAKIQSKLLHSQEPMLHFYRKGGGKNWEKLFDLFKCFDKRISLT